MAGSGLGSLVPATASTSAMPVAEVSGDGSLGAGWSLAADWAAVSVDWAAALSAVCSSTFSAVNLFGLLG
jgi:hypothetical protein